MRHFPGRLLAATATIGIAAMLGACAQPEASPAPAEPQPTPTASATPVATPAETGTPGTATPPEGAVELVDFETRNGTMRLQIPAAWTVDDSSTVALGYDGFQRWDNSVSFTDPDGGHIWYSDGGADDVGAAASEQHVVERIDIGGGLAATAWWERYGDDAYRAVVAVVGEAAPTSDSFMIDGSPRRHFLVFEHPDAGEAFPGRDAAEAYLKSQAVTLALDVLATATFAAEGEAMPAGVAVEHEGTTYLPFTTQNGTSTFLVPREWSIDDTSRTVSGPDGEGVWENWVELRRPNGTTALLYVDYMLFTGAEEEWPWTAGEVRPTTDGLQAVSWALGDTGDSSAGHVGVSLTDQGDATRPTGIVCSDTICRDFGYMPLSVGEVDPALEQTEDFFGSAAEEQLLTVVASLQRHHDDATRMP